MQPLKINIEGDFYDSQIYAGYLHLWTMDGDIISIQWDAFIEDFVTAKLSPHLRFVAHAAFVDSSFLYKKEWHLLFQDSDFKKLFLKRFRELQESNLSFSLRDLKKYAKQYKNPFVFPHADSLIYYNTVYVGSRSGVYSSSPTTLQKPSPVWEGGVVNMAAANKVIALAAGQEGVYEYYLGSELDDNIDSPHCILQDTAPSNFVNWMYGNLFSSFYGQGYLIQFKQDDKKKKKESETNIRYHEVDNRYSAKELLGRNFESRTQMIWGIKDKLCLANSDSIDVVKYKPQSLEDTSQFVHIGSVPWRDLTSNDAGNIVSASSGYFGYVVETGDGLLVIGSDFDVQNRTEYLWLGEELTNWRLFANSRNYTNQLHVIYDDRLTIFSFNQDYFINQSTKLIGLSQDN